METEDICSQALFSGLGIVSLVGYFLMSGILALIYVPKLRKDREDLTDYFVHNFVNLQFVTLFAYVGVSYTDCSVSMLEANSYWVFLNFLKDSASELVSQSEDYQFGHSGKYSEEFSKHYFENAFTFLSFFLLWLVVYGVAKAFQAFKVESRVLRMNEFEVLQNLLKLFYLPLSLSLMLELDMVQNNKDLDTNSYLAFGLSFLFILLFPLAKSLFLRIKYHNNYEIRNIYQALGADYRVYRNYFKVFQLVVAQLEILAFCFIVTFLQDSGVVLVFSALGLFCVSLVYTLIFRPFKEKTPNKEEIFTKVCRVVLGCFLVVAEYEVSTELQEYGIFGTLLVMYLGKIGFSAKLCYDSIVNIRTYIGNEVPRDWEITEELRQPSQNSLKQQSEIKENEVTTSDLVTARKQSQDQHSEDSDSEEEEVIAKRSRKRTNDYSDIDPRLSRSRRRRIHS